MWSLQSFRKYMTFKKDYNELLLYLLRELVKNALHFEEIVTGSTLGLSHIDVKVEELQSKVKKSAPPQKKRKKEKQDVLYFPKYKLAWFLEMRTNIGLTEVLVWFHFVQAQEHDIYDLKPFFTSLHFSRANFSLDEDRGVIRHRLAKWWQNIALSVFLRKINRSVPSGEGCSYNGFSRTAVDIYYNVLVIVSYYFHKYVYVYCELLKRSMGILSCMSPTCPTIRRR